MTVFDQQFLFKLEKYFIKIYYILINFVLSGYMERFLIYCTIKIFTRENTEKCDMHIIHLLLQSNFFSQGRSPLCEDQSLRDFLALATRFLFVVVIISYYLRRIVPN